MMSSRFKITPYTNPSGQRVFRVSGVKVDGHRVRRNFKDPAAAEAHRQQLESEALGLPVTFHLRQTALSEFQLRQAEAVFRADPTVDLTGAVAFYRTHHTDGRPCPTVNQCVIDFLKECRARKLRVRTIADYRVRCQRLVEKFGASPLNTISSRDLTGLIRERGGGHYCQNGLRRVFSAFFSWAIRNDYLLSNPTDKIAVVKGERVEPVILTLAAAKRLLVTALDYEDGKVVPVLAVLLFCGLRPNEYERISWNDFDWEKRQLCLSGRVAKTRSRRLVPLTDEVIGWLMPHHARPLYWSRWRTDVQEVRRRAGFIDSIKGAKLKQRADGAPWAADILRHTAISFWLAMHRDIGAAAAWAGNSPDVIHASYRGLVSESDANVYWSLTPENVRDSKVLELTNAA